MVEHARGISNSDRVETSTPTFDRHGDDFKLGSVCTPEVEVICHK